jgi:hypothetical protein
MAQKHFSELLLTVSDIQSRVPRRTVVPAISSSLSDAFEQARLHNYQLLAMNVLVTLRMKQHQIGRTVTTAMRSPNQMMSLPSGLFCDLLLAD